MPEEDIRSVRDTAGKFMSVLSDCINNNIVIARYGSFATISLLTAMGIAQLPIFFRYKTISGIPSSFFKYRRKIHGRIVGVIEQESHASYGKLKKQERPIICLVRHVSPMGRLMNRATFDFFTRYSPTYSASNSKSSNFLKNLLRVEIAGVTVPPHLKTKVGDGDWLRSLATSRTSVTCTLLSKRISNIKTSNTDQFHSSDYTESHQAVICNMTYRPANYIFRSDLASSLINRGQAGIASGIHVEIPLTRTVDGSTQLHDLQADAECLENLAKLEFAAAKEAVGMWSDSYVRSLRPELIKEVEFEKNASFFSKTRRFIRGES